MSWRLQSIFGNFKVTLSSKKKKEVVDNWWCCHGCWCFSAVNVSDQNKPAFYNTIPCNITSLPIICPLWVSSQKHLTENAIVSQTRAQHTHTHKCNSHKCTQCHCVLVILHPRWRSQQWVSTRSGICYTTLLITIHAEVTVGVFLCVSHSFTLKQSLCAPRTVTVQHKGSL